MKFDQVCVIGLGYIGLPTACMFATNGLFVRGFDVNSAVVEWLNGGRLHIHEPGLQEVFQQSLENKKLVVTDQPGYADAFIIAVPTPFYDDKKADMSYVVSAAESILPYLQPGNLVILESTSPPRTTIDLVAPLLGKTGLQAGADFLLSYSPDRVLPGKIQTELIENPRVIGGINADSAHAGEDLYRSFVKGEIFLTDSTTAEMVKLMENTYRDVNIAVANEFSRLTDRFGVDIWEAIHLANLHPRVDILNPGPGVGGHCISVDPWFLVEKALELANLILAARQVNDSQPEFVVEKVKGILGQIKDKKFGVLGLSYKPNIDDVRESPAIEVVRLLLYEGACVKAYEPYVPDGVPGINCVDQLYTAVEGVDVLLVLVGHSQFTTIDPSIFPANGSKMIFEYVNVIPSAWKAIGFSVYHLGNGLEG
jgi:UDP-N-acetyl-D-mannosaminuronic acid dehydrogenase